jgi:NADH dehydrogenase
VETAGELSDFLYSSLRYYKGISVDDLRIVLLHNGDRLLPELSAALGMFTLTKMLGRGIDVRLRTCAESVTDRGVHLIGGDIIEGGTVICTIGTQPNALLDQIPVAKLRGRLVVNPDMSVPGVEGVWAAGDCAAVLNAFDSNISPATAQFAEAQGNVLASNIVARLAGQPTQPFRYRPKGQLSSVGHNKAVAEISGVRISGFIAWLMWRGLYLLRIPTLARKARLFLEWNWAMFFPPDISHLGYRRSQRRSTASTPTVTAGQRVASDPTSTGTVNPMRNGTDDARWARV